MERSTLPIQLKGFIQSVEWIYAKSMPEWPHEYIVREKVDESLFIELVIHIRVYGYEEKFYNKSITYFDHDGMTYWTMGAPIDDTIIINRCQKEDTYQVRKNKGRLPNQ